MTEHDILELKIDSGEWADRKYTVPFGTIRTFGRERGADFVIEIDPTISRIHFEVDFNQRPPQIRDKRSSNGTFLNGRRINQKEVLQKGDVIRAGNTSFSMHFVSDAPITRDIHSSGRFPESVEPPPVQFPDVTRPRNESRRADNSQESATDEVILGPIGMPSAPPAPPEKVHQDSIATDPPKSPFKFIVEEPEQEPLDEPDLVSSPDVGPIWIDPEPTEDFLGEGEPDREPDPDYIDLRDFDNYETSAPIPATRDKDISATSRSRSHEMPTSNNMGLRRYRFHKNPAFAYPTLLRSLFEQGEFLVVAHFRKIGKSWPAGLEPIDLFSDVASSTGLLPIAFLGDDWSRFVDHSLTSELVANDAIVTLLGRDCISLAQSLNQGGLPGFSVANGFIGWFWPSLLKLMLKDCSDRSITDWFQNKSLGLVYPNISESCIDCVMHGQSDYDIEALGFDQRRR